MIKDCIAVYQICKDKSQKDIGIITDDYIPADGTYIIVNQSGTYQEPITIKIDKKTRELDKSNIHIPIIQKYDYYSKYLNSNKSVDPKKIIQSNNYLSFFIKKESLVNGKLTEQIIDGYFDILANPYKKHTKPKAKSLYQEVEQNLGPIDQETLERNRQWVKENIFKPEFGFEGKDYLKIFFESDPEDYKREGTRYFIPNLFNSNDYNLEIDGKTYGLPDNNLGMNAKKPYLENKDRKVSTPYMVSQEEALLQKEFFDLLMNFNMQAKYNVFINTEQNEIKAYQNGKLPPGEFKGIFLRIQKGKTESEIHNHDIISAYRPSMPPFMFYNVLNHEEFKEDKHIKEYKKYTEKNDLQMLIDDIFFSKMLINNYFTKPEDLSIKEGYLKTSLLQARERIFNWLYKGQDDGITNVIDIVSMRLLIGSIERNYSIKAVRQYNLRISLTNYLKGENDMGDLLEQRYEKLLEKVNSDRVVGLESDQEYYYAVGQLVQYFISLNKTTKTNKTHSLATPFIKAKSDQIIKQKLKQYYSKYSHAIRWKMERFSNLYAMVSNYEYSGDVLQDDLVAGLLSKSLIYKGKKEEKTNE